jgi:hypothetical protein
MLADFGTQLILFMFFGSWARNPAEKAFWIVSVAITFIAILATANREPRASGVGHASGACSSGTIGPARIALLVTARPLRSSSPIRY